MSQSKIIDNAVVAQLSKWQADPSGSVRARGFINSLPFRIAEVKAAGGNYCCAMTFGEADYDRPSGRPGIHESECKPEWLKGAAQMVYEYCIDTTTLKTMISGGSPVVDFVPGGTVRTSLLTKWTFDIVVRW
jgi:hypothetical protein